MEGEAIGCVGGASIATAIIALLVLFRPEIEDKARPHVVDDDPAKA